MDQKSQKIIKIYDEIAEEYARNYDSIDGEEDLIFLNTFISQLKSKSHIVDIGCGTGFSAGWFSKKGFSTEGADLSSKMIDIAKRNYPNLSFLVADMRTFRPVRDTDAVWAGYSLFHFDQDDFQQTIQNVKSFLKPDGIFGLVMQEGEGEVDAPEPFLEGETIYIKLYSEQELVALLAKSGFKILEVKRKIAQHLNEFSYNKLLVIAQKIK